MRAIRRSVVRVLRVLSVLPAPRRRALSLAVALAPMAFAVIAAGCKKSSHDDAVTVGPDPKAAPAAPPTATASAAAAPSAAGSAIELAGGERGPSGEASADVEKRFLKAMAEARILHEKKDYAGAISGFQAALAIAPDDARGLSELGWAAFLANDLDLAERSTKRALELAKEAYLQASSYYNLGRIQEERGLRDDAVASYKKSLELRMNTTVKERLAQLDAALASSFEVLGVRPARGPLLSLEAYCEGVEKRASPARVRCEKDPGSLGEAYKGPSRLLKPGAPYLAVRVIATSQPAPGDTAAEPPAIGDGATDYHLAVRTKAGWFVVEKAMSTENPGKDGITESVEVKELAARPIAPTAAPFLLLRAAHYRGDSNMSVNELEERTSEALTVCGVGPSAKLSCTMPIRLSWSERLGVISPGMDVPGAKHALRDVKGSLTAAFLPDGELQIRRGEGELPDELRGLPGKHTLKFP